MIFYKGNLFKRRETILILSKYKNKNKQCVSFVFLYTLYHVGLLKIFIFIIILFNFFYTFWIVNIL